MLIRLWLIGSVEPRRQGYWTYLLILVMVCVGFAVVTGCVCLGRDSASSIADFIPLKTFQDLIPLQTETCGGLIPPHFKFFSFSLSMSAAEYHMIPIPRPVHR